MARPSKSDKALAQSAEPQRSGFVSLVGRPNVGKS
ncbi:MAG: hypothetical protein RIR88_244, partial [Actinomycetota bacterium]